MKVIREAYCSFAISKLLKERGFDEPCRSYFINDLGDYRRCAVTITNKNCSNNQILRPTYQMALTWLREIHYYYIQIMLDSWALGGHSGYYVIIQRTDNDFEMMLQDAVDEVFYQTYEEAVEGALRYTLERLISPKLKEDKDSRIKEALISVLKRDFEEDATIFDISIRQIIDWLEKQESVADTIKKCKDSWYNEGKIAGQAEGLTADERYWQGWHDALEKQGEHANFLNKIQVGDKVTRNQDGVLVNLSQLKRVAKKDEKQSEQNPVIEMKTPEESLGISSEKYNDIVNQCLYGESQFKVGDWVICTDDEETVSIKKIIKFYDNKVKLVDTNGTYVVFPKSELKYYHLWSIADARRGDVLVSPLSIFIFKRVYMAGKPEAYCGLMVDTDDFIVREPGCWTNNKCWPATKEEQEMLFSGMKKSGYEWDVKNKELIPLQPVSKPSKVVWSDEDETGFNDTLWAINKARTLAKDENDMGNLWYAENWLKELKEKIGG